MSVKMGDSEAKELMLAANLKPLEAYPGGANPWKCKCLVCGKTVNARLKIVKRGGGGCKFCGRVKAGLSKRISEKDAIKIMKSVGLIPLEPYTGSNKAWKARCKKCKKIVFPRFSLSRPHLPLLHLCNVTDSQYYPGLSPPNPPPLLS
jgi:hypothetical protein